RLMRSALAGGAYHWQYRATQGSASTGWIEFGIPGNTDFIVASPVLPAISVANVGQYQSDGTLLAEGASTTSTGVVLRLTPTSTEFGTPKNTDFMIQTPSGLPVVTSVGQFHSDGTPIAEGGTISESTILLKVGGSSPTGAQLTAFAEVRPLSEPFHNTATLQN